MSDVSTLKRCPFCGGAGVAPEADLSAACFVECGECGARTKAMFHERIAIELWNQRVHAELNETSAVVTRFGIGDRVSMRNLPDVDGRIEGVDVRFKRCKGEEQRLEVDYRVNWFRENMGSHWWYSEEDLRPYRA